MLTHMRVSVVRGGGFAGLVRTTTADTHRLSPGDGEKLTALVGEAGLVGPRAASDRSEPQPDRFSYQVIVEDGQRSEVTGYSEQSLPPKVRNLISWMSTVDGREEKIEPPGGAGGGGGGSGAS
jgi:hypothetical protein